MTEGDGGGNITEQMKKDDRAKLEYLRQRSEHFKCKAGNRKYCSYAENHPVETAVTLLGGLVLAGVAANAVAGATAAEGINVGISVAADCATTLAQGRSCSAKDALITGTFSVLAGGIRGRVASLFTLETPESMLKLIGANMLISAGSNTLQRTAKGKNTTEGNLMADIIAGGLASGVQMNPDVDPATSGPIAQLISGVVSAFLGPFNPHPGQTIIQTTP